MRPGGKVENEWLPRLALGAVVTGGLLLVLPALWMAVGGGAALLAGWVWGIERRLAYSERVVLRNLLILALGMAIAVGLPAHHAREREREAAQEAR